MKSLFSLILKTLFFVLIWNPVYAEGLLKLESPTPDRDFYQYDLRVSDTLRTVLTISGPSNFLDDKQKSFPTLVVSAGFFTGPKSLELIPNPGPFVIVNIPYSVTTESLYSSPEKLGRFIHETPQVMAASYLWVQNNPYFKISKLAVLGVSLGTLMSPSAISLAMEKGFTPDATILLYGGAEFRSPFLALSKRNGANPILSHNLANVIEVITTPTDPRRFLPKLLGSFLLVYGTDDAIFSKQTSELQFQLLNGSKERHFVEGPHIDSDQPEVIKKTFAIVMDFLNRQGF